MYRNYIKIAFRNLLHHKVYSFINIAGLAHGLACCLLIVAYIQYEVSFDTFHAKANRITRLLIKLPYLQGLAQTSFSAGHAHKLEAALPDIESVIRTDFREPLLTYNNTKVRGHNFLFADSTFLQAFSFPLVAGDPKTALRSPFSMVITESAATSLFGREDPMGKSISVDGKFFSISGIAKDCPRNSHLFFEYLAPFHGLVGLYLNDSGLTNTYNWNYTTYVVLKPGVTISQVESQLPAFLERDVEKGASASMTLQLQPLKDIHFGQMVYSDQAITVDPRYLQILGAIGFVILFIACANFMNLSTARSIRRAREVGLRKVFGSVRRNIVIQFMSESMLTSLLAIPLAIAFGELILPTFNDYVHRSLSLFQFMPMIGLVLLAIFAGFAGGFYPALYLSHFRPIEVLKGRFQSTREGLVSRRILIIVQYTIAAVLMIATLVAVGQFRYMRTADPGYRRDHLIQVDMTKQIQNAYSSFRERLLANPHITAVTRVASPPGYAYTSQGYLSANDHGSIDTLTLDALVVDEEFVTTMGLTISEGRDFSVDHPTDETESYLINQAAQRKLGLINPLDHPFQVWSRGPGRIIGVVNDFHFRRFHEAIDPLVIRMERNWLSCMMIRTSGNDSPQTIAYIENLFKEFSPEVPFSYVYHDDALAQLYRGEERLSRMLGYLTASAIFIASLGLFGLASYSAEQRIKELGMRKVLGASTGQLIALLTRQFSVWVVVAVIIASPIAYFVSYRWLQNFAYRVTIGWEVFLVTLVFALIIAMATVIFQTVRAARMNPANALRYE